MIMAAPSDKGRRGLEVLRSGGLEVWRSGGLEVLRSGGLEAWIV